MTTCSAEHPTAASANRPVWFDPRMPDRSRCVLSSLLRTAVAECPDRTLVVFSDGTEWSYAETERRSLARAAGLRGLGVAPGDRVLAWLPNGPDGLLTWFATNLLGACFVPLNTAARGPMLASIVARTEPCVIVGHGDLLPRLEEAGCRIAGALVAVGPCDMQNAGGVDVCSPDVLDRDPAGVVLPTDDKPWDVQSIIFTSGTTGESKGVLSSYFHLYTVAEVLHGHMTPSDRILVNAPLFHVGGTGAITAALIHRGSVALTDGFKAAEFWQLVERTGCTMTSGLLGSMAPYLAKFGSAGDRSSNRIRRTHFYPVSDETIALARDFDFEYYSGYGMTELPLVLVTDLNTTLKGSCGRPRSGVECRLVDEHDQEVPIGQAGELIVRTDHPWSFFSGYHGMPDATLAAWRNGWFHTGDLLRKDADGNYYFVDRLKDSIRRRGENISSHEVEEAVRRHPDVNDAAAVAVPGEYGEDEVLVVVVYRDPQSAPAPEGLFRFVQPLLPHFATPRFVRAVASLPMTPTGKVRKHQLREEGVTPDTWDRVRAGIRVRRDVLTRPKESHGP